MNIEKSCDTEDEFLHQLLQSWQVDDRLPPFFEERVWRRIALREITTTVVWRLWGIFTSRCRAALRQPAMAAAYLALVAATGAGLGYWKSERYAEQTDLAWRAAYLQSVNPYAAPLSK